MAAGEWYADFSEWPLVIMRLDPPVAGPPRFSTFEASVDQILSRRMRCTIVLNLTGAQPDAARRRQVVALARARRAEIEHYIDQAALVVPSPLLRGALTAFQWLLPRPLDVTWKSFASERAARTWIAPRTQRTG